MTPEDDSRWAHLLRPRTLEALAACFILLSFATLAAFMPAQNDTWWHLAAGRRIAETRAIELADHFSWTAAGHYWPNHEWLTQLLFYGAHTLGGMPLLTAAAMVFVVTGVLLMWQLMVGPPLLRAILLVLSGPLFVTEWSLRPKVVTLAGVALTLTVLVARRYAWLPLIFAVWANMHGAVALGVVALAAACVHALVHDRAAVPRVWLASLLALAATSCTPLGFSIVSDVVLSLRREDYRYVTEWQPAGVEPWTWGFFVLVVAVAPLVWRFRALITDRDLLLTYVGVALLPLAVRYSRNIPPFSIVAMPLLSSLLLRVEGARLLFRSGKPRTTPLTIPVAFAGVVAAAAVTFAWSHRLDVLAWDPLSRPAAEAIGACPPPIYNHFDNGGPIIWFVPGQPVFIDSRQHPYQASFVVEHFEVEDSGNYRPLFERYSIRCAVLPPYSKVGHALVRDGWRVTYRDASWVVAVTP